MKFEMGKRKMENDYLVEKDFRKSLIISLVVAFLWNTAWLNFGTTIFFFAFAIDFLTMPGVAILLRCKAIDEKLTVPAAGVISGLLCLLLRDVVKVCIFVLIDPNLIEAYKYGSAWLLWSALTSWILSHNIHVPGEKKSSADELWTEIMRNLSTVMTWVSVEDTDFGEAIKRIYHNNLEKKGNKDKLATFIVESACLETLDKRLRGNDGSNEPRNIKLCKYAKAMARKMYRKRWINDESYNSLLDRIDIILERLSRQ